MVRKMNKIIMVIFCLTLYVLLINLGNNDVVADKFTKSSSLQRCGSGYSRIPDEIYYLYSQQESQRKSKDELQSNNYIQLKNENNFYGFTYSIGNNEVDQTKITNELCEKFVENPKDVKFVDKKFNSIIEMYISAVIESEKTATLSKRIVKEKKTENKLYSAALCVDINCGVINSNGRIYSFNYRNIADIESSRIASDLKLFAHVLNELRTTNNSVLNDKYTEFEIVGFLRVARKNSNK